MTLYAVEAIDDAVRATREFLRPASRSEWLKLALVTLLVGGSGTVMNPFQYAFGGDGMDGQPPPDVVLTPEVWALIALVVALAFVVGLVFLFISSVMEFVLIEALRHREVTLRRYWGRRWRQGLRLFAFRIVFGLFVFGAVALLVSPLVLAWFGVGPIGPDQAVWLLLPLVPVLFVLAVVSGLVYGFTTAFVVPVMIVEDCGVVAGWRRLWGTITDQLVQYLGYAVVGFFLSVLGSILVGILTAIAAIVLAIPFGIVGVVGLLLLAVAPIAGWVVIGVVGLLFLLALVVAVAVIQAPVKTYLRYYALLVLGDVESDLDLIPAQRADVRGPDVDSAE